MKETGKILKETRERKGISLNDVAIHTKINIRTLQAIEAGDSDRLPPKTFLRGFLRSYAKFLGLDIGQVMETYRIETGENVSEEAKEAPASEVSSAPGDQEPQMVAGFKLSAASSTLFGRQRNSADSTINAAASPVGKIILIIVLSVAVIAVIMVFKKMESYEQEAIVGKPTLGSGLPNPELAAIPANKQLEKKTEKPPESEPEVAEGGQAQASPTPPAPLATAPAAAPPTPKPSPTAAPTATPTPSPSPTPTPTPSPAPSPKASPTPKPSPTPVPAPVPPAPSAISPPAPPAATPKPAAAGRTVEILIEALDNVDVEATIDSEPPKSIKLTSEAIQTFKGKKKIVLRISDGGAVNLIVNGVDRGVPGDLGRPLRLELP